MYQYSTHLIVVPSNNIYVRRDRSKVLECLLVTYVSRADYLLDFSRNEELFELRRQIMNSVWDVQIANDED